MTMSVDAAARTLFDYLVLRTPLPAGVAGDLIIGFGHFDLKIPRHCGGLWRQGCAPRVLFTGGIGAGTADLKQPEALCFRAELRRCCPEMHDGDVLIESDSTNTGENVTRSIELLRRLSPERSFDRGIERVILVANAYRQRRVWLTCRLHLPEVAFWNSPPPTTFEQEVALFAQKGEKLNDLLVGEIKRIAAYGERGWIVPTKVPTAIWTACGILKSNGIQVA